MSFDPEGASAALFARLQQAAAWSYTSRVVRSWDDTQPAECPALYQSARDMAPVATDERGLPPHYRVPVDIRIYTRNDADPSVAPATQINALIAAVINALKFQPGEAPAAGAQFVARPTGQWTTTLGGRCVSVRVVGAIEIAEGTIGGGGGALIPLEMILSS